MSSFLKYCAIQAVGQVRAQLQLGFSQDYLLKDLLASPVHEELARGSNPQDYSRKSASNCSQGLHPETTIKKVLLLYKSRSYRVVGGLNPQEYHQ
jgi:hypothetical protein